VLLCGVQTAMQILGIMSEQETSLVEDLSELDDQQQFAKEVDTLTRIFHLPTLTDSS